jgi:hypothetical protein
LEGWEVGDSGVGDSGVADSEVGDSGVGSEEADSEVADSEVADSGVADSGVADSGVADSEVEDSEVADSGVVDSEVEDSEVADSVVVDSVVVDSVVVDSAVAVRAVAVKVAGVRACGHTRAVTERGQMQAPDAGSEESMLGLRQVSEVKKCGYCTKTLDVGCFSTNPKTSALYSKCEVCRPKHAATCNAKRDADLKKQAVALEAGETPATLICNCCGIQPFTAFGTNEATGKPRATCNSCHVRKLEADTRYNQSEAGKEADKRYREGDAGQESAKRFREHRQDRRRASTAMQMDCTIQCASNKLISGRLKTSPTFVERTGFASEAAFLSSVEATFAPGMTFANHSPVWELDHKIPREAYDFDDPEDVRRCWSPKNVHALTRSANAEKSWKLVDQYIFEAGVECLPVAWNDRLPDADFKNAHAAKMLARKILQDEAAAEVEEEEQPSSSSGLFVEEAPDSDSD